MENSDHPQQANETGDIAVDWSGLDGPNVEAPLSQAPAKVNKSSPRRGTAVVSKGT